MPTVKFKMLKEGAIIPEYASASAAGADLHACCDEDITISPHCTALIPTGLALELPDGYVGLVYARSGIALKRGLAPANKVGVIDSDYRGEIMVALHNHSPLEAVIGKNERIAQLVITPFLRVDFEKADLLGETERGDGGFGSTGK